MSCRAKFTFIKGPCLNDVITHDFERDTTVLQMKQFLVQVHHACDPSSSSLCFVWEEHLQKITDDNMTVASFGASVSITVSIIKRPGAFPPAAAPVTAPAASSVGATSPPETEVSRYSVYHAPSLPPTSSAAVASAAIASAAVASAAVASGPSASASTSFGSNSVADSPKSEAIALGPNGPDIIVGSGEGLLEAKMQLELPEGCRNIKCYAGCSLLHLQSALVGANLMTAHGQQLVKACARHVQLPLDTPLASLNRSKLLVIERTSAAGSVDRAALSQQISAPSVTADTASFVTAETASFVTAENVRSRLPLVLNESVGINAEELERRQVFIAAEQHKKEEERKRILAAHDQEQKDNALHKQMALDKLIADNNKAKLAASPQSSGCQITLGSSSSGSAPSKVKIGTAQGGIEVVSYDDAATLGTLRAVLVGRGLCAQEAPIVLAIQL